MHDYLHFHCSIDCCFKLSLVDETLCQKWLSFHKDSFLLNSFGEMGFFKRELQTDAQNSNFEMQVNLRLLELFLHRGGTKLPREHALVR